jgi:membrane protein
MTTILILLGLIAVLVGLLGTIYPAIPGLGLMFGGAWLLAYAGNYQVYGTNTLIFIGIAAAFGMAMDYVSGVLGAKYTGASKQALWGAFIGGIPGAFLSLPGLLLGPLVGAGVGEFIAKRDMLQAGKVSLGTFIGFIIGMIAKVGCALAIVLTLLSVWIFNLFT